ncbi:M48 family metallopeptidase [Streptomyces sp. NPDC059166]|uniref:M48 family metallopeptidase n=1 Tax=Streptomyces sp. NPDC059166 TaxID=3346752 RepID=UPI0036BCFB71
MSAGLDPDRRLRIDERVLDAGTGPRFATLLLLMLTASGAMILEVYKVLAEGDDIGCSLAAGVDPDDGKSWNMMRSLSGQATAFRSCMATWAPPPPWWQIACWPLLVVVTAGVLFAVVPRWRARRSRVVPLESVDPDGTLLARLGELCAKADGTRPPRVVVDPAASSVSAVVFGRTRRPVICLHGGLLAIHRSDQQRFQAVLLHELAHIANRDVTLTYLTVALWRAFLALVLLPYTICLGYVLYGVVADNEVPRLDRATTLVFVMVLLLYLSRSEILRSREIYADLTAVRWGADRRGWSVTVAPPRGPVRNAVDSFLELWRTHPRWGLRQGALTDPAPLFRSPALPLFLIGTVPVMAVPQVTQQIASYQSNFTSNLMTLLVVVPGALAAGVLTVTLWRAVVYALLTRSRVPSGAWAGCWLGAGMSAGLVLSGFGAGWSWSWLPARPWVLLVPVMAGSAFGWWITQCARLWSSASRGRTLRPALVMCTAVSSLVMVAWLTWWMLAGAGHLNGYDISAQVVARNVLQWLPSAAPTGDLSEVPGIATVMPQLDYIATTPMCSLVITLLWVFPLLALARGRSPENPGWEPTRAALADDPVPPLRTVLRPGLIGGALACLAVVGVQAYVHSGQPVPEARGGLYALRYAVLLMVAVCLPATVTAVVASAVDRRYRLLGGLIAGQVAAFLGLMAMALLGSVDGCVAPLGVLSDSCAWRPAWWRPLFPFTFILNNTLVITALTSLITALVVGTVRCRRVQDTGAVGQPDLAGHRTARICAVVLLCATAVIATGADGAFRSYQLGLTTNTSTTQLNLVQKWGVPDPPRSEFTRLRQIRAWYRLGGDDLIDAAFWYDRQLTTALRSAVEEEDRWGTMYRQLPSVCGDWEIAAYFELIWFRMPADTRLRTDWHQVVTWADLGSRRCAQARESRDNRVLLEALRNLRAATRCAASVNARIDKLSREGGYRGTSRPGATGPSAVCDHSGKDPTPANTFRPRLW